MKLSNSTILDIKLTLQSDIFLGQKISGNNYQTTNYIPASTLKGALLTKIRSEICTTDPSTLCDRCSNKNTCEFIQIRKSKLLVRPGCLLHSDTCKSHQLLPINPLTITQCKNCNVILDSTHIFIQDGQLTSICPNCKKFVPIKKPRKNYCLDCQQLIEPPTKSLKTNVAIDSVTGTAIDGMLYFYEVIERGSTFSSQIMATDPKIKDYLTKIETIVLGRGRSRGLGSISIAVKEIDFEKQLKLIRENIEKAYQKTEKISFITVTNLCSIEIADRLISYPYIKTISLDSESFTLNLLRSFGNCEMISGWAFNTDTQKPQILTATAGSVFCYEPSSELNSSQLESLARLELFGVGEETLINNSLNQILFLRN